MHTPCCPLSDAVAGRHRAGARTQSVAIIPNGETQFVAFPDLKDTNGLVVYVFFQVAPGAAAGAVTMSFAQQAPQETFGPNVYAPISDTPKSFPATGVALGGVYCIQQHVPVEGVSAVTIANTLGIPIERVSIVVARRAALNMVIEACGNCSKKG